METMNIRLGTTGTIKVGRNTVKVTVTGNTPNGWKVLTASGREMTVRNLVPDAVEAPRAAPARASAPRAARTPAAPAPAGERRLSLINAAAAVLERSGNPMNVKQMIGFAKSQGLWSPGAGKTPEQTLYAAILREIKVKGSDARFVKESRGHFKWRG